MTTGIKYKWLLLISVWAGSFLLCCLINSTVNNILDNREKKEILQKDEIFWKQNAENISIVSEKQKLLTHEIESLKLGLVFLDDAFNRIGSDFELKELKVEMDPRLSQDNSIPVKISFNCLLKNGLNAIKKIQEAYAFLPVRHMKINQDELEKQAKFDILMDYNYHILGVKQHS